jgi:phospholipase C
VLPIGSRDPELDTPEGDSFFARARSGTLPPVVFIDPDFVQIPPQRVANDDHPPADVGRGQALIAEIYQALVDQPGDRFANTLFVITYDEHGGFYDHVPPPGASSDLGGVAWDRSGFVPLPGAAGPFVPVHPDASTYGPRVPTIVISPQVDAGGTTDVLFDHTSIGRTILLRFLGHDDPSLGGRMSVANHLGHVLRSEIRTDRPRLIPIPPPDEPDEPDIPDGGSVPLVPAPPRRRRPAEPGDFHEAIRRFGRRR